MKKYTVNLCADGKNIPLNSFVEELLARTLVGMTSVLKGASFNNCLELRIQVVDDSLPKTKEACKS